MAELVNQRIEEMINELEQMQRTNLYTSEEIREISRKRKEFEYKIQRQTKQKEDFVYYIAYEIALLEDISFRRKQAKLNEKKKDIEYAIAKRLNKIFKQFIYRFQNDIEVYFQYIKFCKSVGFEYAISGIIGQMLQMYGDKPKMWQMASMWEHQELNNLDNAREFLLKGIHRHPATDFLYLDLINVELSLASTSEEDEVKEKQIKKASIIWKNAIKNIVDVKFLFKVCDLTLKYKFAGTVTSEVRSEIWSRRREKDVWAYIALQELNGSHWIEIDEFVKENASLPSKLNNFISVYEEAVEKFSDENLCTKYIHDLLAVKETVCSSSQLLSVVKQALKFGHKLDLLASEMYAFWFSILKEENIVTMDGLLEILNVACKRNPTACSLWEEKLLLNKSDEKQMEVVLEEAHKFLETKQMIHLWNVLLENIESKEMVKHIQLKLRNCDSEVFLAVKPKLLQRSYELCGLKCARNFFTEVMTTPPIQLEVYTEMINIELLQDNPCAKHLRKCYEGAIQYYGSENTHIWLQYIEFETTKGNVKIAPSIYQRAVRTLKKSVLEDFIKSYSLARIKQS